MLDHIARKAVKTIKDHIKDEDARDEFDVLVDKASDRWEKIESLIWRCKYDIREAAGNVKQRALKGYTENEYYSFMLHSCFRFANICAYLEDARYPGGDKPSYYGDLRGVEQILRGTAVAQLKIEEDMLGMGASPKGTKLTDFGWKTAPEKALDPWMWIFDNLFDPETYVAPIDSDSVIDKAIGRFRGEITYKDVRFLPSSELSRVSSILKKTADITDWEPSNYETSENALQTLDERGANWKDSIPYGFGTLTHAGHRWDSTLWGKKGGGALQKSTRAEIGLSFVAWVEDLSRASTTLAAYAAWISPLPARSNDMKGYMSKHEHPLALREYARLIDEEEAREIDEIMRADSRRVWEWLGRNLGCL